MNLLDRFKQQARRLKAEVHALYLACRDPRVPWAARLLAGAVVAYAFSPIDLIPDFIPVLGLLDDLILVPLGIALVLRMIPPPVMTECREKARLAASAAERRPVNWWAGAVIIAVWLGLATLAVLFIAHRLHGQPTP